MNKKQRFAKYDWLISKTQSVLEHYNCPESCNASCCRNHNINFYRKEYEEVLKNVDVESVNIIKSNAVKSELNEFHKTIPVTTACPLLVSSKCRIYENRPESCRKFPFVTFPDAEVGFVLMLFLCPLSVNIIHDYAQWYKSMNLGKYNEFIEVYKQYQNINANNDSCVQINENNLDPFIASLEKNNHLGLTHLRFKINHN